MDFDDVAGREGELALIEMHGVRKRTLTHVWNPSPRSHFTSGWWGPEGNLNGMERWVALRRGSDEVARCKYTLSNAELEIQAIEVAANVRREGIGRAMVQAIRDRHPEPRMSALSWDHTSHRFWESIGWIRREHHGLYGQIVTSANSTYFDAPRPDQVASTLQGFAMTGEAWQEEE